MYNPYQPFINLVNANLALLSRFATSRDITRLVQESVNRSLTISQEGVTKASQTNAYEELTRGLADNVARFTQEYVSGISQSVTYTQNLSRQMEQGTRQFAQIGEQARQRIGDQATQMGEQAAEAAVDDTEAGLRSVKAAERHHSRNSK